MTKEETTVVGNLRRLLGERTRSLAAARREMRREKVLRARGEARLQRAVHLQGQLLAQARRLTRQILSAQEEERKQISRELHDEVAQILAGINVRLASLRERAAIGNQGLQQSIAKTQRLVKESVEVVHRYARELRPALLDDLGLIPALRSYIRDLPGRNGLRVQLTTFPEVETLDSSRRTVLFRVAQEALTNVARHARARSAQVRMRKLAAGVRLEIHDDGRSFAAAHALASSSVKRLGLLGMRERVEMMGGTFTISSVAGQGTTVRAEIPWRDAA